MKFLSITVCLVLFISCASQEPINLEKYPILKIAHETSLYRNDVDWKVIDKEYVRLAKESADSTAKLSYLLNATGDSHGTFRSAKSFQIIAHYTDHENNAQRDTREFNSKFHTEVINNLEARFEYKKLKGNVGYLKIVGIGPQFTLEENAKYILEGVQDLQSQGVDKWVLDLRYNGGGNFNPMLAGLSGLVGEGKIAGSADKQGNSVQTYEMKSGKFYDSNNLPIDIENPITESSTDRVAVLLSQYTVSSGELVAVAFKGRENTRFFGENTGGLTTVTGYDFIDENILMLISKAYYEDRKGNVYKNGVEVDEEIKFIEFPKDGKDEILEAGVKWLNEN